MGYASQILHMIIFIIFMLTSLNGATHFDDNHHVKKVSGEEEYKGLSFKKLRVLFGLQRFVMRKEPLLSPTEAPAPAPMLDQRVHFHHFHSHRPRIRAPRRHRINKMNNDQGILTRTVVLVIVSASAMFVFLGIVLIWGCSKFRKRRRETSTMAIIQRSDAENNRRLKGVVTSQISVKKVNSNSGPDQFCIGSAESVNASANLNKPQWSVSMIEKVSKEVVKSDSQNVGSAAGEVLSVGGSSQISDERTPRKGHSDDNESFHTLYRSHSSNASESTRSDTSETVYPYVSNLPMTSSLSASAQPSPPSAALPLQNIHTFPSTSRSKSMKSTALSLSALSDRTLTENGDCYLDYEANHNPGSNLKGQLEIPQPPFCPPFMKTPPPPPSQLHKYRSLDKDGNELPKLKPLHWDKVRTAADHSMVWDKIRSSSFEFDEEMIESLFGYNVKFTLRNDEAKSKSPSPKKHVLEQKRLQNVTIVSKALSVTADQICDALMLGAGLSLQQLEALLKMGLSKEEEGKLKSYKGDTNELGSAEKILKTILHIPFAFSRIEAMLYKETFEDEVALLRNSFSMLEDACKELRSTRLFLKLLEAVLKTGNRMNIGTIRGGARAFKLDALLKLADVKGTDGKTTLLHFVVQEIIRTEGIKASDSIIGKINQKNKSKTYHDREEAYRKMGLDLVSGLTSELFNVRKAATIDFDAIASSLSNLSQGMAKLHHLVHKDLSKEQTNGNFVLSMRSFLSYAEKKLKELQEDEVRVLVLVKEITEYFHGNVSKDEVNPLRIFVIVRDFLCMLDHVCKEIRNLELPHSSYRHAPSR